jgi:hypothetical protein
MKTSFETYNESRLEGRRQYELRETGVFVTGEAVMAGSFETLVLYSQLLPVITTIYCRPGVFRYGVLSFPAYCFVYYVLVAQAGFAWDSFFPGACAGMALLSVIFMIATYKKIEYARFCTQSGIALLDIAKSGPDSAGFDKFVSHLQAAIENAKNSP